MEVRRAARSTRAEVDRLCCLLDVIQPGFTQLASQVSDTAGEVFTYDLESCVRPCGALTPSPMAASSPVCPSHTRCETATPPVQRSGVVCARVVACWTPARELTSGAVTAASARPRWRLPPTRATSTSPQRSCQRRLTWTPRCLSCAKASCTASAAYSHHCSWLSRAVAARACKRCSCSEPTRRFRLAGRSRPSTNQSRERPASSSLLRSSPVDGLLQLVEDAKSAETHSGKKRRSAEKSAGRRKNR